MTSSAIEVEARSMARSSSREDNPEGAHYGAHADEGALDDEAHDGAEPSSCAISKQTHLQMAIRFSEVKTALKISSRWASMNDLHTGVPSGSRPRCSHVRAPSPSPSPPPRLIG